MISGLKPRDIHEPNRAATTLELLFDLVMVVAVGTAASGLHHAIVHGHIAKGLMDYAFCFFAIWLSWWNFSWFASAYDDDDTEYRIIVFVQMVGAMIMAVGNRDMFSDSPDFTLGIIGYVIMRLAMVTQWLRAAKGDTERRTTCRIYAVGITVAQIGWCLNICVAAGTMFSTILNVLLIALEISIPFIAERHGRIPWHAHHIAERHALLVIIVLGEGVLGSINATAQLNFTGSAWHWLPQLLIVCFATAAITFGLWWHYFHHPFGHALEANRDTAVPFGYLHYFVFASVAAVGAGFEVLADAIEKDFDTALLTKTAITIAIALAVYFGVMLLMHSRTIKHYHLE